MLGPDIDLGETLAFPTSAREYLVESDFAPPGASSGPATLAIYSTSSLATAALPTGFSPGSLPSFEFRLSSADYNTTTTDPDRPNEQWDGRLINPGEIIRSAPLTPVGGALIEASVGQIVVANGDGAYDTALDLYSAVSQEISIRMGTPGRKWADFATVARMRITGVGLSLSEMTLDVEDTSARLSAPYPVSTYAGTGGIEGDPEIADQQRQVVLGFASNVNCTLIDRLKLIYQIHDGPLDAVVKLMDSGVALQGGTPQTTYAGLAATAPPAGGYRTCLPLGLIRLGDEPAGPITADVRGHDPAGDTLRSVATFLASEVAEVVGITYDPAAFAQLSAAQAGWVWNEPFTYGEALSRFVGDAGQVWGAGLTGILTCARLQEPEEGDPTLFLDDVDILEIERLPLPSGYESTHSRRTVRFGRVWRPLGAGEIAGVVSTSADAAFRQVEWRQVFAFPDATVPNASTPEALDTSIARQLDAQNLADRLIDLHGKRRQFFRVETKIFGKIPSLLSSIDVTYPRFGLSGGKTFRLVSTTLSLQEGTINYYLWG